MQGTLLSYTDKEERSQACPYFLQHPTVCLFSPPDFVHFFCLIKAKMQQK